MSRISALRQVEGLGSRVKEQQGNKGAGKPGRNRLGIVVFFSSTPWRRGAPLLSFLLPLLLTLTFAATPTEIAQQALTDWQAGKYQVDPLKAQPRTIEDALRLVIRQQDFSPPIQGIKINQETPEVEQRGNTSIVKFPAVVGSEGGQMRVTLRGDEVTRIGFVPDRGLLPEWIKSPLAWVVFSLFSLLAVLALRTATNPIGRLWRAGWALVRQYGRMYLILNVVMYGLFVLGMLGAYTYTKEARLLQELVGGTLEQIGAGNAGTRGPFGLALFIFYWNTTMGLFLTTAVPGLLLGIPALLLNAARYYVFGFALSPALLPTAAFLWHIPTLVIELQAYILGTFGGLVLLSKVLRGQGFRAGLRALALCVFLGIFFLLIGAWYESFEVLYWAR